MNANSNQDQHHVTAVLVLAALAGGGGCLFGLALQSVLGGDWTGWPLFCTGAAILLAMLVAWQVTRGHTDNPLYGETTHLWPTGLIWAAALGCLAWAIVCLIISAIVTAGK